MLERIGGASGLVGLLAMIGGIALIADQAPIIAGGIALVVVGLALFVRGIVRGFVSAMGMDGLF